MRSKRAMMTLFVAAAVWLHGGELFGSDSAPTRADSRREQRYSDRLRRFQREYLKISEEFEKWCASHGQRVGPKGAQGDLGCVASPSQSPAPTPAKPEDKK